MAALDPIPHPIGMFECVSTRMPSLTLRCNPSRIVTNAYWNNSTGFFTTSRMGSRPSRNSR